MEDQSRRYHQWFPIISFKTKINNIDLQLSYTTKTKRPTYSQLSSNILYGNRFLLQTGNPFLKPTLINDITLVSKWRFIQLMISYKNELDAIIYWTKQNVDNPAISILSYSNFEKLSNLNIFIGLSPKLGGWYPQFSAGFMKQWVSIISNNQVVKLNKPLPIISLKNSFKLPWNLLSTLDINYLGNGDVQNLHLIRGGAVVNMGINKSFFKERLNISLQAYDIFHKNRDGNLLYNNQMELYQMNWSDSRKLELTLRFKFNTDRSKYKGKTVGVTNFAGTKS